MSLVTAKKVLIVTGEASGDLHAANLVNAFRKINSQLAFTAVGGKQLRNAGVNTIVDITDISVVGVWEVLAHLNAILAAIKKIKAWIREQKPDLVILVDSPDLNLRIAKTAKECGAKVVYYVSPQVWAWRQGRVKTIKKLVDKMLVIFPFEEKFYQDHHVPVAYVGHPLIDQVKPEIATETVKQQLNPTKQPLIALLPGSRKGEIERLLPVQIAAARQLNKAYPTTKYVIPLASTLNYDFIQNKLPADLDIKLIDKNKYAAIQAADAAIVTSGTVTLELALLGTPMVVIYKLSHLTYWLGRLLVKIPFFSMCNIIAGKEVAKELLQYDVKPETVANEINRIISDPEYKQQKQSELKMVKEKLGDGGCSANAAQIVNQLITTS